MKKIFLLTIFFLNISIFPALAAGEVIIDRLTTEQAEDLNIVIPYKTPPGFHSITIEVYDDNGTVNEKEIPFCKNLVGEINWNNECPDLVDLMNFETLKKIRDRDKLPTYSPAQEPEKSNDLQIAAFAALALLAAGTKKNSENDGEGLEGETEGGSEEQEELTGVEAGALKLVERDPGWGDRSITWQNKLTPSTDLLSKIFTLWISKYSPLIARTSTDASYLRAIFGSLSFITLPLAVFLGIKALVDTSAQAMAPALITVLLIVSIGILDAFAGLIAASIFFIGVLVTGHISSRGELLTVAGLMLIFFAPALLASAVRPLRRLVRNTDEGWERITDYALAILLTGWTVDKMVNALNGLASVQLAITFQATQIALWSSVLVAVRIISEDITTYHYPVRLNSVSVKLPEPDVRQKAIGSSLKTLIFIALAAPFVGLNFQLLLGAMIFLFPLIADLTFAERIPKFEIMHRFVLRGTFKVVMLVFIGAIFGSYMQGLFQSPKDFLKWSFVLLAIPGLIIAVLEWFAKEPKVDWKESNQGRWVYRVAGVLIFVLAVQMVRGVDLANWIFRIG
jgi:hypothetical protein